MLPILALDIGTDTFSAVALGAEPPARHVLDQPPAAGRLLNRALARRVFAVLGPSVATMTMDAFILSYLASGWRPGDGGCAGSGAGPEAVRFRFMTLALRARWLFDGTGPGLADLPVIVVEGERVKEVISGGVPPKDAELIDLGDVTLLPGLIDTHVHVAFDGSADPAERLDGMSDEELFEWMREAARQTLDSGVTTVRDLGDRSYLALRLREQLRTDHAGGPHIVASGPPITTTRGHCWFLGGQADGVDQLRLAVRERARRGVDVIKVMASGGEITPGSAGHLVQYGPTELDAIADEAHRHGLPITAHAHAPESIGQAVAAGFDMIEHCSFITEHGIGADPALITELAHSPVIVSLTLGAAPGAPPLTPRMAPRFDAFLAALRAMRQAGVKVVCGSDSGIVNKPHGLLSYGAAMMVQIGYTPLEALQAVTSAAAQACGVGHRKGRIAPGYDADLLA